jgi:hypothetical protein
VKPKFYRPHAQFHRSRGGPTRDMALVVKTDGDPLALAGPDPRRRAPARSPRCRSRACGRSRPSSPRRSWRRGSPRSCSGSSPCSPVLLCAVGVSTACLAMGVAERRQEIGVRLALGAPAASVGRLVLVEGLVRRRLGPGDRPRRGRVPVALPGDAALGRAAARSRQLPDGRQSGSRQSRSWPRSCPRCAPPARTRDRAARAIGGYRMHSLERDPPLRAALAAPSPSFTLLAALTLGLGSGPCDHDLQRDPERAVRPRTRTRTPTATSAC